MKDYTFNKKQEKHVLVEQARYLLCSVCMPHAGCNWNMPLPQWRCLFWMFSSTFHTRNYRKKRPICACHKGYGEVAVYLHLFLTSSPDGLSPSLPRRTKSWYPLNGARTNSTAGLEALDKREISRPSRESNHVSHEQSSAFLFFLEQQLLVGQGLLIIGAS